MPKICWHALLLPAVLVRFSSISQNMLVHAFTTIPLANSTAPGSVVFKFNDFRSLPWPRERLPSCARYRPPARPSRLPRPNAAVARRAHDFREVLPSPRALMASTSSSAQSLFFLGFPASPVSTMEGDMPSVIEASWAARGGAFRGGAVFPGGAGLFEKIPKKTN